MPPLSPRFDPSRARFPRASIGAAGAALVFAALAIACGSARGERPRGVLLVSVDSLRADHLSSYGYRSRTRPDVPTTPTVDRMLAGDGMRFERAYSTTSWTLPAHMALFTGMPDELHGVRGVPDQLHPSRPWLAESLRAAGWRTAGFWSGPNLHPYFGFDRGFELYRDCSTVVVDDTAVFAPTSVSAFEEMVELHERSHEGVTGPRVVAAFREWFDGIGDDERFFAFVHFWDVHYDYEPPREHDLFYPGYRGPIDGRGFTELEIEDLRTPESRAGLDRLISLYDAEIHFTDLNVGHLLGALDARERLDDTLVVFLSDHGEEFLDHRTLGHKLSLFEETVRVPLILRFPGVVPERAVSDALVGLVDVAPTILELAGVPLPASMWGTSLVPLFEGRSIPARSLPLELSYQPAPGIWRGSVDARHKVLDIPSVSGEALLTENLVVFDLASDAREKDPRLVPKANPNAITERALALWSELDRNALPRPTSDMEMLPPDLVRGLQAAGYLGSDDPVEEGDRSK